MLKAGKEMTGRIDLISNQLKINEVKPTVLTGENHEQKVSNKH
jgi:hypothetical protein